VKAPKTIVRYHGPFRVELDVRITQHGASATVKAGAARWYWHGVRVPARAVTALAHVSSRGWRP
jgi:hypothetical protein